MAASRWVLWAAVALPLLSRGGWCSPDAPACPVPCLCQAGPSFNCSSAGLSHVPPLLPAFATDLDLSRNLLTSLPPRQPRLGALGRLWLGRNNLTHLSLCVESRPPQSTAWPRQRCMSWAPALQLLAVERNQLEQLPQGLGGSRYLQVLHLSHNRISALGPGDLRAAPHLRELRLEHNLITSLHPQALQGLPQLRILDLSFNLLTAISPSAYLSLRPLGAGAELGGNPWRCDCGLRGVKRWLAYDRDSGQRGWGLVCASPSALSGTELLQLEEGELTCSGAEAGAGRHQDVTAEEGTEVLLPCSSPQEEGSTWWTPSGRVSGNQAGLLISDITTRDAGLYICVSRLDGESVAFVFDLEVRQRRTRGSRSLPGERQQLAPSLSESLLWGPEGGEPRSPKTTSQSDLALAVCLSVFITFLIAFILGVLARPLLESLWRRIRSKRSSSPAGSASAGQGPCDNEAYSDEEETEYQGGHRERRVTFSYPADMQRDLNAVQYYDTVASDKHKNQVYDVVDDERTYENVQRSDAVPDPSMAQRPSKGVGPRADNSASDTSSQQDTAGRGRGPSDVSLTEPPGGAHTVEFEPIPDPEELGNRRSASESSSSDQESSDIPGGRADPDWPGDTGTESEEHRVTQNPPWPQPRERDHAFRQQADSPAVIPVTPAHIPVGGASEIPGFSSEPFADWTPGTTDLNEMDSELWNNSTESFDFPESFRSTSVRSSSQGSEPTEYTVNPEREEEEEDDDEDVKKSVAQPGIANVGPDVSGDQQRHSEDPYVPSPLEDECRKESPMGSVHSDSSHNQRTLTPTFGSEHSDSSHASDDEPTQYIVNQEREAVGDALAKEITRNDPPLSPPDGQRDLVINTGTSLSSRGPVEERRTSKEESSPTLEADPGPGARWAALGLRFKGGQDIKPPQEAPPQPPRTPPHPESSSSESEEETAEERVKRKAPGVPHQDSSLSIGDVPVSLAPRRALNINLDNSATSTDELRFGSTYQGFEKIEPPAPLPQTSILSPSATEETGSGESLLSLPYVRRGLDIKPPQEAPPQPPITPPHSESSSSESEEETAKEAKIKAPGVPHQYSSLSIGDVPVSLAPRRALNINLDNSASSTDDMGWRTTISTYRKEDVNLSSSLPKTSTPSSISTEETRSGESHFGLPYVRRGLDIKPPQEAPPQIPSKSPPGDSSSSSSGESGDEIKVKVGEVRAEVSNDSSLRIGDVPVSLAPRRALNINLATSTDESRFGSTYQGFDKIEPPAPLPQTSTLFPSATEETRSGESLLGLPYVRRGLDIKPPQEAPPQIPSKSPPGDSSSSSSGESGDEIKVKLGEVGAEVSNDSSLRIGDVPVSLAPRRALNINLDNSASSTDDMGWRTTSSTYRKEDVNLSSSLPTTSTPSSISTEKTRFGESHFGLPYIRRRLDIKPPQEAPLQTPRTPPRPESSSSESEEETAEERVKRKAPGVPHQDSSLSIGDVPVSLAPRRALNINLATSTDELRFGSTYQGFEKIEPPAPLPQTSTLSHSGGGEETRSGESILGLPYAGRRLDIKAPQEAPPQIPSRSPPGDSSSSSSGESGDEIKVKKGEVEAEVSNYSSLRIGDVPVSLAPRRALNINLDNSASSTDDMGWRTRPEEDRPGVDSRALAELRAQGSESPSRLQTRPVPDTEPKARTRTRLRRRLVVDIQVPVEAPPLAPDTPSPSGSEEAAGIAWRSHDLRSSTSAGDGGGRRLMGAAAPYRPARQYQSVTSETISATIRRQMFASSEDGDFGTNVSSLSTASSLHFDGKDGSEA